MPRRPRGLSVYDHFLALCFAQFTYRESLRDLAACLNARPALRYHLGFRGHLTRTNLAYANERRSWRLFAAVAQVLMRQARRLYQHDPAPVDLPEAAFALDASLIHLSARLFPWAACTKGTFPEVKMLEALPVEPGGFYILNRGYLNFHRGGVAHDNRLTELYRRRWQVELFFKWIKQHLRLRGFFGTTPNAVQCQVWSAICVYLLVAILKKELGLVHSLHEILQILSLHPFEQTPVQELLAKTTPEIKTDQNQKLLNLNTL